MRYLVVFFILFFYTLQTFAQQEYFVYLQTDNGQAFYVRANNMVYSSTAAGYLILSKTGDTSIAVTIGFPKNIYPEQPFNIPANHKDAGFVLKNFGDKGWGMVNLLSQAVIMNSNATSEKKKPESAGTRRTDAFSLLLSNAVNDTAVLYTVSRPPRTVASPLAASEKKKDSIAGVKKASAQKDSAVVLRKRPEKDSSLYTKKIPAFSRDTIDTVKNKTAATGRPIMPAKNADTVVAVSKKVVQAAGTANLPKKDSNSLSKTAGRRKKDTLVLNGSTTGTRQTTTAKLKTERRDTIIMMSGTKPAGGKPAVERPLAKNNGAGAAKPRGDSVQTIRKEIMQAPEEKRGALLSNKEAVIVQKIPVKNDSVPELVTPKTDTGQMALKTIRRRPLVNMAAELLTDTSYIAVFVDESHEKFDTIRISIPFNEMSVAANSINRVTRPDTTLAKTTTDTLAGPPTIKVDTALTQATRKDTVAVAEQPVAAPVAKADSVVKKTDSAVVAFVAPKPADTTSKPAKDSMPVSNMRDSVMRAVKNDSIAANTGTTTAGNAADPLAVNTDCKEVAAYSDIDKLRVRMLVVLSDEDRIALARKLFKQKCLLVSQVKALSELFKTDDGKYKWFDAVYAYTQDTGLFSSLGSLLRDDYYLARFKAMLRH